MGGACGTKGRDEGNTSFGRPGVDGTTQFKWILKLIGCKDVDGIIGSHVLGH
jgi:hypothetical protein